jgi:Ni,Fe-hydrogenase I large subunit
LKVTGVFLKLFLIIGVSCGSLFAKEMVAKDMVLTTLDGMKLVLHADNTWVFQDGKRVEVEKDFTVPVANGKIVLVATDGTWGYVEKEIKDEEKLIRVDSITGNGHSMNRDIVAATAEAQKQALNQTVSKMKNALRLLDIDPAKLADCVKRVEKDVDKKEDFKQNAGWDVSIKIVLDKGSIFAVADCAKKVDNDTAAAAKKKPKKK